MYDWVTFLFEQEQWCENSPHNIYELLTPIALAHLIMGDGSVSRHGLILCTDSYSV